jgi:hypothetical protein
VKGNQFKHLATFLQTRKTEGARTFYFRLLSSGITPTNFYPTARATDYLKNNGTYLPNYTVPQTRRHLQSHCVTYSNFKHKKYSYPKQTGSGKSQSIALLTVLMKNKNWYTF